RLSSAGDRLAYSSYLGGSKEDAVEFLSIADDTSVVVTGYTKSMNFPITSGAYDDVFNGSDEMFVTRLSVADRIFGHVLCDGTIPVPDVAVTINGDSTATDANGE